MSDIILGVDVGASGGIAVIDAHTGRLLVTHKTPESVIGHFDLMDTIVIGAQGGRITAIVEKVTGRYGDSAHSSFSFGFTVGTMHAAIVRAGIHLETSHPKTWMKHFDLKRDKGEDNTVWKNRLKRVAMEIYPDHKVTLWNADAILIGVYGKDLINGKKK